MKWLPFWQNRLLCHTVSMEIKLSMVVTFRNDYSIVWFNQFSAKLNISANTIQLRWFFKIPPRTDGVDFLAHRGSSWYPTPIPTATDFSSNAFPQSSLRKTTHLPIELRGGQKIILVSSQWKISDIRMIDSSEFFRVCMGRKSEPFFLLTHHSADLPLNKYRNIST